MGSIPAGAGENHLGFEGAVVQFQGWDHDHSVLVAEVVRQIMILLADIIAGMKRQHAKTLALIFRRPVSANVKHADAMALLVALGAIIDTSREGSRVGVTLFGEVRVFHKPHPTPNMDKGAVAALRDWLEQHGVSP